MKREKRNELHRKLKEFGIPAFYMKEMDFGEGLFLIDTVTDNRRRRRKINYLVEERHQLQVYGNRKHRQAVLRITEEARDVSFDVSLSSGVWTLTEDTFKEQLRVGDFIDQCPVSIPVDDVDELEWDFENFRHFFEGGDYVADVVLHVPKTETFLLLGWDEDDLFISRLPEKAYSVKDAHKVLKPEEVGDDALRQGEFFFVPVDRIPSNITAYVTSVLDSDHRAVVGFYNGGIQYVSGLVRHPRHKDLDLGGRWHRVYRNREVEAPDGVMWD